MPNEASDQPPDETELAHPFDRERVVRRHLSFQKNQFMNRLIPFIIISGTWVSAEMLLPGGQLQNAPLHNKLKVSGMTALCALGFLLIRHERKLTKEQLDRLAEQDQLEPVLREMMEKYPGQRKALAEVGEHYRIFFPSDDRSAARDDR
ncbi:MAG: hypothetical protein Q7R81_02940 [Candidatus Peregrinibacteria bacterium]|nr:hypothetical protein [Candidatus Peregrinibacteria bacterium]